MINKNYCLGTYYSTSQCKIQRASCLEHASIIPGYCEHDVGLMLVKKSISTCIVKD